MPSGHPPSGTYDSAVESASGGRLVAFLGSTALLFAIERALAESSPVVLCPPCSDPVTIDGSLEEWDRTAGIAIGEAQLVRRGPGYAGTSDLSGRIHVCRSATTLYVAGEIEDDTLFWNPQVSWLGDGVELFLDFHPRPAARKDPNSTAEPGYDTYAHQLTVHPLANEVRWKFAIFRGRTGRLD